MCIVNTFGNSPGQISPEELWQLPTLITEPGTYLTRAGETVVVSTILPPGRLFRCLGEYTGGVKERWHVTGRVFSRRISANDIVSKG